MVQRIDGPSRSVARGFVAAVTVLWAATAAAVWNDNKPINLLRHADIKLETTTASPEDRSKLAAFTDGDPASVTIAAAKPSEPLDVVFGFGGKTVALEKLIVQLPQPSPAGAKTHKVEILVSTVSPNAGFHSLRVNPLEQSAKPQSFSFPSTAASWIMLRFTPSDQAKQVSVAEVEVMGREGPPATHYEFKESPAKAFDVLARLKMSDLKVAITPDEESLFEDARDGKLENWSFAEAALLASGVTDKEKRQTYLAAIDRWERGARQATTAAKSPFERGEQLLTLLHAGPMAKGYESHQTDVSVILETGKFNCVSSAAMYNILGRRLGLDLRAIEVPDHAFSILYDGTRHADVETTTAQGFNPARDPASQKQFEQQTGFRYIPESNRDQRREINEVGLVAIIYYNHGVMLTDQKKYHEALVTYFRALSLDAEFDSAVKNALAVLANWSNQLSKGQKFAEAIDVLATGLDLAPEDGTLRHNHKVVWGEWADATMKSGDTDQALDILHRAAQKIPGEASHFDSQQAWLFVQRGEDLVKAKQWEQAMAAVEPGFAKLEGRPRDELRDWRNGVYLRWSSAEMDARNFARAAEILEQGMKAVPDDKRLANNLAYTVQQWVKDVNAKSGEVEAQKTMLVLLDKFATAPDIKEIAKNHVRRVVMDLRDKQKYEEALASIDRHKDLLARLDDKDEAQEMAATVFDAWAERHMKAKEWEQALAVYEQAQKRLPGNSHVRQNLVYAVQEWGKDAYARQGDEAAQTAMLAMLTRFADVPEIKDVGRNHFRRVVIKLRDDGKYDEALAAIGRHAELLKRIDAEKEAISMTTDVYNAWAKKHMQAKRWNEAVGVYEKARSQAPPGTRPDDNLAYVAQEWAKDAYTSGGEEKARPVLVDLLKRFAGDREVRDVAQNHFHRVIFELRDKGKYDDALAAIDRHKDLLEALDDKDEANEMIAAVYEGWARTYFKKDWAKAIEVYQQGLKQVPNSSLLKNNLEYCQEQAKK